MNDITRKQMNDVIVPQNDIIRRPSTVPEPYVASVRDDEGDRIGKNPFFEKTRKEKEKDVPSRNAKHSSNKGILWGVLFVVLMLAGFLVADYFATASIEITPVVRSTVIDEDITALKDANEGGLTFDTSTPQVEEKTKEISATIERKVQKKASGKVDIYNAYSASEQRLIKNTRLEDNVTHKIYRIDTSVVVPGATVVKGKVVTPGSVEAVVYADMPGDVYDIKPLGGARDFSIPGFKGDPRYKKFYGRMSEKSPISGGRVGTEKAPSDEAVTQAQEELKQDLKKIVVDKVRANIPPNKSFFPGSVILKFEEIPLESTTGATAKVSIRATASVFFFDTVKLTQKLAEALPAPDRDKTFTISNMPELVFGPFTPSVDNVVLADLQKISFHIKGTAKFVGQVDEQKIRAELVSKSKKDFSKIIAEQKNISKADATVRPMWKSVFPSDISKITVNMVTK